MSKEFLGLYRPQWLILLAAFALYCLGIENAVFVFDDGVWLGRVQQYKGEGLSALTHLVPWEGRESLLRHPRTAVFLHLLFYLVYPSAKAILVGIALCHTLALYFFLRAGNLHGHPRWGELIALLYFRNPAQLFWGTFRLWQIAYLPLVLAMFFYTMVLYVKDRSARQLFWMAILCATASHFHMTALSLISIPILLYLFHRPEPPFRAYLATVLVVLLILSPWLVPYFRSKHLVGLLPLIALFAPWLWKRTREVKGTEILALIAALPALLLWKPAGINYFTTFFDALVVPRTFLPPPLLGGVTFTWFLVLGTALVVMGTALWRARAPSTLEQALLWANFGPLSLGFIANLFHPTGRQHTHYTFFLLPAAWAMLSWFLLKWTSGRRLAKLSVFGLIGVYVATCIAWPLVRSPTGGCARLGIKYRVVEALDEATARTGVVFPYTSPGSVGCLAPEVWRALIQENGGRIGTASPSARPVFAYLAEPHARGFPADYRERLLRDVTPFAHKTVGQVELFFSHRLVPLGPTLVQ